MEAYFVLDERGEPRREMDQQTWTRWFERADRGVARTVLSPSVTVLTTFSGVDAAPESDTPLLFETRVFGGVLDGEENQSGTRAEALATHSELAAWCRVGAEPDYGLAEEQIGE
jgi:hypothetical protein